MHQAPLDDIVPHNSPANSDDESEMRTQDSGTPVNEGAIVQITPHKTLQELQREAAGKAIIYAVDEDPETMEPFSHLGEKDFKEKHNPQEPEKPFPYDYSDHIIKVIEVPKVLGAWDYNDISGKHPSFPFPIDKYLFRVAKHLGLMRKREYNVRGQKVVCVVHPPANIIRRINLGLLGVVPSLFRRAPMPIGLAQPGIPRKGMSIHKAWKIVLTEIAHELEHAERDSRLRRLPPKKRSRRVQRLIMGRPYAEILKDNLFKGMRAYIAKLYGQELPRVRPPQGSNPQHPLPTTHPVREEGSSPSSRSMALSKTLGYLFSDEDVRRAFPSSDLPPISSLPPDNSDEDLIFARHPALDHQHTGPAPNKASSEDGAKKVHDLPKTTKPAPKKTQDPKKKPSKPALEYRKKEKDPEPASKPPTTSEPVQSIVAPKPSRLPRGARGDLQVKHFNG